MALIPIHMEATGLQGLELKAGGLFVWMKEIRTMGSLSVWIWILLLVSVPGKSKDYHRTSYLHEQENSESCFW